MLHEFLYGTKNYQPSSKVVSISGAIASVVGNREVEPNSTWQDNGQGDTNNSDNKDNQNNTTNQDTPGTDTPGTDTPGTDTPGTDTPGTDTPGTGTEVQQ